MLTLYRDTERALIKDSVKLFLEKIRERDGHTVWMVLESARDEEIRFFLNLYEDGCNYLFNDTGEALKEAGAAALSIGDDSEILEWIADHWGKNWFSFFVTDHESEQLIAHMSSLCNLSGEGKSYLFRYYEPVTFACWVNGLKEAERVDEALGIFSEVYVETPVAHMLMQYTFYNNGVTKRSIDLLESLNGFALPLPKPNAGHTILEGCWKMERREYEHLAPVSLNAFKIRLCKKLTQMHNLLDTYSFAELYSIIDTAVGRAVKYGMRRKDVLAYFVNIRFEYEEFWYNSTDEIERIIQKTDMDEVDRLERVLKAAAEAADREESIHAEV